MIFIVDFGSQVTQLIARRVREASLTLLAINCVTWDPKSTINIIIYSAKSFNLTISSHEVSHNISRLDICSAYCSISPNS